MPIHVLFTSMHTNCRFCKWSKLQRIDNTTRCGWFFGWWSFLKGMVIYCLQVIYYYNLLGHLSNFRDLCSSYPFSVNQPEFIDIIKSATVKKSA